MDFENGKKILKDKETLLVHGTNDPFINDSRFAEMNLISEKLDVKAKVLTFEGKHDIDSGTLLRIAQG
jgi:predicted esterase